MLLGASIRAVAPRGGLVFGRADSSQRATRRWNRPVWGPPPFVERHAVVATHGWIMALFRDSISDALSAVGVSTIDSLETLSLTFSEPAVDVVARTYKVRAGVLSSSPPTFPVSFTFNGKDGGRVFGNIPKSSIKITEIRA